MANRVTGRSFIPENRPTVRRRILKALWIAAGALFCHAPPALANDVIIDAAMGDINGDGRQDLAILTLPTGKSSNDVGIAVYLRDPALPALKRTILLPARFWGTSSAGQQPEITILENRSITVHTENMAFGREHWERTYTLAWRNAQLIVAGFTYTFNDTLDHDQAGSCDLNLLTGRGIRNGVQFATGSQRINLVDWDDSIGLTACRMNA